MKKDAFIKFSSIALLFLLLITPIARGCGLSGRYWSSNCGSLYRDDSECDASSFGDWCLFVPYDRAVCWLLGTWPGSTVWIVSTGDQGTCTYSHRGDSATSIDCDAECRDDQRFVSYCNAYGDGKSSDSSPVANKIPSSYNGNPCGCWGPNGFTACYEYRDPTNDRWDWSEKGCVVCSGNKETFIDWCTGTASRNRCESACGAHAKCDEKDSGDACNTDYCSNNRLYDYNGDRIRNSVTCTSSCVCDNSIDNSQCDDDYCSAAANCDEKYPGSDGSNDWECSNSAGTPSSSANQQCWCSSICGVFYDGCESNFGASSYCDEKNPSTSEHCNIVGEGGDVYWCNSNCQDTLKQDCGISGCSGTCGTGTNSCTYRERGCSSSSCYSNPHDADTQQSYCSSCGLQWNIGGEVAATNCCGDDSGERARTCVKGGTVTEDACPGGLDSEACCSSSNKCVYNGNCYAQGGTHPLFSNLKCRAGKWDYECNPYTCPSKTCSGGDCGGNCAGQSCTDCTTPARCVNEVAVAPTCSYTWPLSCKNMGMDVWMCQCSSAGTCTADCYERDSSQSYCEATYTGCQDYTAAWNIGGEVAATNCCGDDCITEFVRTCVKSGVTQDICSASNDNLACCSASNKCVYKGVCYSDETTNPDYPCIYCNEGTWENKDDGSDCPGTPGKCCSGVCDDDGTTTGSGYHSNCRSASPSCLAQGEWGYTAANDGSLCGGYNCRECSSGYCNSDDDSRCTGNCDECNGNCQAKQSSCTGNCDVCSGSGTSYSCLPDESICESNYKCSDCTGSETSFSCTYDDVEDEDCSATPCPDDSCFEIPDNYDSTWDYADDEPNFCLALDTCTNNPCNYVHECADADSADNYPLIDGSVRTCNAVCDQDSDCASNNCLADCTCESTTTTTTSTTTTTTSTTTSTTSTSTSTTTTTTPPGCTLNTDCNCDEWCDTGTGNCVALNPTGCKYFDSCSSGTSERPGNPPCDFNLDCINIDQTTCWDVTAMCYVLWVCPY